MSHETLFDIDLYSEINEARWPAVARILDGLPKYSTCLDVGCGVGWFSDHLLKRGLKVTSVDGREENVRRALERVPAGQFLTKDVESREDMASLSVADLVFCFGLLYHLENPFVAIRNLHRCTGKQLLVETQVTPDAQPTLQFVSEGANETQGLTFHAIIPSRLTLVKMLKVAGFASVQRYTGPVEHEDFRETPKRRRREIYLAGNQPVVHPDFVPETEPLTPKIDYSR